MRAVHLTISNRRTIEVRCTIFRTFWLLRMQEQKSFTNKLWSLKLLRLSRAAIYLNMTSHMTALAWPMSFFVTRRACDPCSEEPHLARICLTWVLLFSILQVSASPYYLVEIMVQPLPCDLLKTSTVQVSRLGLTCFYRAVRSICYRRSQFTRIQEYIHRSNSTP